MSTASYSAGPRTFAIVDPVAAANVGLVRIGRIVLVAIELLVLTGLVAATRCANYGDVFVGGKIYFTDADCYARMTRVRLCAVHPGLVVRHHDFENYPVGTPPHTTAPLDYLILGLSLVLRPWTVQPIDSAGALISPLLGILTAWFLWWWSRCVLSPFRWILLALYIVSPPLVHATELGRPDHQSLVLFLVTVGLCAEYALVRLDCLKQSGLTNLLQGKWWGVTAGAGWALAIWVSAYEPVVLFAVVVILLAMVKPRVLGSPERCTGWIVFAAILTIAFLVERRLPSLSILHRTPELANWSATIGELHRVPILSAAWFGYVGYLIVIVPVLAWLTWRRGIGRRSSPARPPTELTVPDVAAAGPRSSAVYCENAGPIFTAILLLVTFFLTSWQVRWSCFFALAFAVALATLLGVIPSRAAVWIAFALSILPILGDWDARLWPNESELALKTERRLEMIDLREIASSILAPDRQPFLAPWWLSPAIAYWSGQPGVAGSSHEALNGTIATARFYLTEDAGVAREMLQERGVHWVIAYDADRTATTSSAILGKPVSSNALCGVLDRTPARAPKFLRLSAQNGTAKLYQIANNR